MSLDLSFDYNAAKKQIAATSAYKDLKKKFDETQKKTGDSQEQTIEQLQQGLDNAKKETKRFQKEIKTQFEQLLDINNITGGKGSNSIGYIKKLLIQTLKNIEPKIAEIINEEALTAIGCDQQQTYTSNVNGQGLYIKVSSIDLGGLLKKDPGEGAGKVLYEKNQVEIQKYPFSMNRELYQRIQSGQPFDIDNGSYYLGKSGQQLFNITYEETNPLTGVAGGWYKITLANRVGGVNKVGDFLLDYFGTIKMFDFETVLPAILESLCGAISISANIGVKQAENATQFELIIQRIFGLCFDNVSEIDVSGTAKLAELDGIDDSFFEFTGVDLRNIEQRIANIQKGVVTFVECNNVDLPVDVDSVLIALENLRYIPDSDLVDAADKITQTLADNPEWQALVLTGDIKASIDFNFVKLIAQGLVVAVLSPKVLLPIFTMLKVLDRQIDQIVSYVEFAKQYKKFIVNFISKVGAIFVQELFELIKKDILNLLQQVIKDLAKEKVDKRIIMILKLIQLIVVVARFISDFRKCKSVIDEILWLLKIALQGWGGEIPLPLLAAAQLLDGYSETRAFIGTISELQKLGIPTGDLPDGSPNLGILSILGQLKATAAENAENGKTQIFIPPLAVAGGSTLPTTGFGKSY